MTQRLIRTLPILAITMFFISCGGGGDSGAVQQPSGWQRESVNPLIVPTLSSKSLDYGVADPSVLFDSSENKWKLWFSTTIKNRITGTQAITISYSESVDGLVWADPQVAFEVSSDPNAWDYTAVETPAVIKNPDPNAPADKKYLMWYSGANTTLAAAQNRPDTKTYYQIGLAYSADGKAFIRYSPGVNNQPGLVLPPTADVFGNTLPGTFGDGILADPDVIFINNKFHMWLSSHAESVPTPPSPTGRSDLAFGISHLTSVDGITWTATHSNPLASLYKSGEVAGGQQPSVVYDQSTGRFDMWFSNDTAMEAATIQCSFNTVLGFWHAASTDGVNWTADYSKRALTYDPQLAYESSGFLTGVKVISVGGKLFAYYSAFGTQQIPDPALYTCPDPQKMLQPAVLTLNRAHYIAP